MECKAESITDNEFVLIEGCRFLNHGKKGFRNQQKLTVNHAKVRRTYTIKGSKKTFTMLSAVVLLSDLCVRKNQQRSDIVMRGGVWPPVFLRKIFLPCVFG